MLAVIPYTTFPTIELGPLTLRTFGLFVALGVLVGAWLAAAYAERFGIERDDSYRVATWMVLAGIVGARLTWAATHTDEIESPVDVIAIWEGGIQFAGGFIAALIVGLPFFRRWSRLVRWRVLDAFAFGLTIGLALGRVGCYAVGEHFGRTTDFVLANRYDGGEVREPVLGDVPLQAGLTFHNTSLYELLFLLVIFAGMGGLVLRAHRRGRALGPGVLTGVFVLCYGIARLGTDTFRVNDERVAMMTGAQWMCLAMILAGAFLLTKVRPRLAALAAETTETPVGAAPADADDTADADDDEVAGDTAEAAAGADDHDTATSADDAAAGVSATTATDRSEGSERPGDAETAGEDAAADPTFDEAGDDEPVAVDPAGESAGAAPADADADADDADDGGAARTDAGGGADPVEQPVGDATPGDESGDESGDAASTDEPAADPAEQPAGGSPTSASEEPAGDDQDAASEGPDTPAHEPDTGGDVPTAGAEAPADEQTDRSGATPQS